MKKTTIASLIALAVIILSANAFAQAPIPVRKNPAAVVTSSDFGQQAALKLHAEGSTVTDSLRTLAEHYKVRIQVDPNIDPSILEKKVAGEFNPQPLSEILKSLTKMVGASVTFRDNVAYISGPQNQNIVGPPANVQAMMQRDTAQVTRASNPRVIPVQHMQDINAVGTYRGAPIQRVSGPQPIIVPVPQIDSWNSGWYSGTIHNRYGVVRQVGLAEQGYVDPYECQRSGYCGPSYGYGHPGGAHVGVGVGVHVGVGGAYNNGYYGYYDPIQEARRERDFLIEDGAAALHLDGPDKFLQGVDVYKDGCIVGVGSQLNNWHDGQAPMIPLTVQRLTFVRDYTVKVGKTTVKQTWAVHRYISPETMAVVRSASGGDEKAIEVRIDKDRFDSTDVERNFDKSTLNQECIASRNLNPAVASSQP